MNRILEESNCLENDSKNHQNLKWKICQIHLLGDDQQLQLNESTNTQFSISHIHTMHISDVIQFENANDSESDSKDIQHLLLLDLHSRQLIWGDINEDDLCHLSMNNKTWVLKNWKYMEDKIRINFYSLFLEPALDLSVMETNR